MARLVGAMAASHAPSIGAITDWGRSPSTRALRDGFDELHARITEARPDVIVLIYDDHVDNFFFNALPAFAIGVGESHAAADEGRGAPDLPPLPGAPAMAAFLARHLIEEGEFDLTVCHELAVDHGVLVPLRLLEWGTSVHVIPIVINGVEPPMPTARRCWRFGQALAAAIDAWPGSERVLLLGTGGLSHQLGGRDFGRIDEAFDRRFLEYLCDGPREAIAELTNEEINGAGNGANEIRNWIAVAGAVPNAPARLVYYEPLGITGTGIIVFDGVGEG